MFLIPWTILPCDDVYDCTDVLFAIDFFSIQETTSVRFHLVAAFYLKGALILSLFFNWFITFTLERCYDISCHASPLLFESAATMSFLRAMQCAPPDLKGIRDSFLEMLNGL